MRPLRRFGYLVSLSLLCSPAAFAVTLVNSTWLYGRYSNPANWMPAEVPNNTADKSYNVIAPSTLELDMNATVSSLSLNNGFNSPGYSFAVVGTTTMGNADGAIPDIRLTAYDAPVTFSTGRLTTFSAGVLSGKYELNGAATLQFGGANITTLRSANLRLNGADARIVDENGNDALRSLRSLEPDATLSLSRAFTSVGDMTVNGVLNIGAPFVISGSLTNFDAATRTLRSGSYYLTGNPDMAAILQFAGADIVNNAALIYFANQNFRIVDAAGRDALRNFAHNLPNGRLWLDVISNLEIANNFTNDGLIGVMGGSLLKISGALLNYDPSTKRLSGGSYQLGGFAEQSGDGTLSFSGADIVHNASSISLYRSSTITDQNNANGLRNFADNEAGGIFELVRVQFNSAPDFTNAGTVSLYEGAFTVPSGHRYTQTGGTTSLSGSRFNGDMQINGGELTLAAVPRSPRDFGAPAVINGNVIVGDASLTAAGALVTSLQLTNSSRFRYVPEASSADTPAVTVSGTFTLAGTLQIETANAFPVPSNAVFQLAHAATINGAFSNGANGSRVPTSDGLGSFVVTYSGATDVSIGSYQRTVPAAQLLNISTRAEVLSGDDVVIGGFIVFGRDPKKVVIRAIGPSLAASGVSGSLQDPVIELHDSKGGIVGTNDNWQDSQATEISGTGLAPSDPRESAMAVTLQPGAYTVVVRGKNDSTGVALVEVYDLSKDSQSKLANISTRGFIDADHVLIGGLICGGNGQGKAELTVRAIGTGLQNHGVKNFLADPALEVRDGDGSLVAANDDFGSPQENMSTVPLALQLYNFYDAATGITVPAGRYTVVVHGKNSASGTALVEIYDLNR